MTLILLLASAFALASGGARAAAPTSAGAFFGISRMEAVAATGGTATRYSVTVTNAPAGNTPYARWYLDLQPPASPALACSDAVLPGGAQIGRNRYRWKNQGTAFVWYHGSRGTYASDRSYGCDQSSIGRAGYPGTVTVVFENDSQHCTATFTGIPNGAGPAYGPQPLCALGGYIPLPVPRSLLQIYASADTALTALIRQVQAGTITGRGGALGRALAAIVNPQGEAFNRLFPPVWGCAFGGVFNETLRVRRAFDAQLAELATGRRLPGSTLAADVGYLKAMASGVGACRPTPASPIGAPPGVYRTVRRLTAEAATLRDHALRAAPDPTLAARLRSLAAQFDGLLSTRFPVVFGMRYSDLLNRVILERSSLEAAQHAAEAGNTAAALSALKAVAGQTQVIRSALRKQATRSTRAANAA